MKFLAGITLLNPDIKRLKENIGAIYEHCYEIVLVDNNSKNIDEINDLISLKKKVSIIYNDENKGVAYALNQIINFADINNYIWVLLLDQDSVCLSNIFSIYEKFLSRKSVSLLSPRIVNRNGIKECNEVFKEVEEVNTCITSGSFVHVPVCKNLGGFDNEIFIDGVDFDYAYRVRLAGFRILRCNHAMILHEIGENIIIQILFFKICVFNHSGFRKFYMVRNLLYLSKKKKSKILFIKAHFSIFKILIMVILFENKKLDKIKRIFDGYKSGIKFWLLLEGS